MSTASRGFLLIAIFSSLAACGSAPNKGMDAVTEAKVTASQAVVGIKQPEIYAATEPVAGTPVLGGGAIASGFNQLLSDVGKERADKVAEDGVQPLREALKGFDFDSLALSGFQADLPKAGWLHLGQVTITKDISSAAFDKAFDGNQVPDILFMTLDYHLSYDFRQLIIAEHLWLSPRPLPGSTLRHGANGYTYTVPASDPSSAIYENTVTYMTAVPEGVIPHQIPRQEAVDDAVQYWAKDGAAMLRARLTDAVADLSRLSLQALQNPGNPPKVKDEVAVGHKEGQVLENHDNARFVIQFDDGSLMSIDASLVRVLRTGKMD